MKISRKQSIVFIFALFLAACAKSGGNNPTTPKNQTPADKISGLFSGSGKRMPQGILLGSYTGCITPVGWQANLITGPGNANVTKVTNNTINITLAGGPFANNTFSGVPIVENGGSITFAFGSYDENTGFLSISANIGTYLLTNACLTGLPYYSGSQSIPFNGAYIYQTIGHVDFTGTK